MSDISVCKYCIFAGLDMDEEPCLNCAVNVGKFQLDLQEHDTKVRAEAIDEFVSMLTTKEIAQTYDFDDVLCEGNYDANFNDFRNYVRAIAEQLKEKNG